MKTYSQFLTEDTDGGFYAYRNLNVQSAEFLYEWMKEHNIPNPIPKDKLHVTVVCSECDVPGYTPDPALVMVNPASFKIDMMNEALVIKFRSDALEEQWQRAMNMGAKSRYPRFTPHVSLSYQVPETFDITDLKPPPSFLVFDAEQSRPLIDGWADSLRETSGDIISDNPGIYVPQNSLNIPREQMPQISDSNKMEFVDWLEEQGIVVQYMEIPVAMLRSVQDTINLKKVENLANTMPDGAMRKPVIVSKDHYILDGHHRWLALLNRDPHQAIAAYRVNIPIKELLAISRNYRQTFYKTPEGQRVTA
jgi:hypothetical protein